MKEGHSRRPSAARLYSLLCLMVAFWALNFVIARVALREIPSMLVASLRIIAAGFVLLPMWIWRVKQGSETTLAKADLPLLALVSLLGVSLNQLCFLSGFDRTSTGHAAILVALSPLFVLALSAIRGIEPLTMRKLAGMGFALAGISVLQLARSSVGHATLLGDLLIVGSSLTFALFTVAGKKLTRRYGGLTISTFTYLIGGGFLLPVAIWHGSSFDFSQVSSQAWMSLAYMVVFASALAYVIFYYALTYIPASKVSTVGYLQPFLATLLGVWLLGDTVSSELVAGGSLVLTGVFLTERG